MAGLSPQIVATLQAFATEGARISREAGRDETFDVTARQSQQAKASYEARIDETLQQLHRRVQEQRAVLEQLRQTSSTTSLAEPASDPQQRLRQLQTLKAAYDDLAQAEPILPPPDSALPALLALRATHQLIGETKVSIATTQENIAKNQKRLHKEEADLRDSSLITSKLKDRIETLQATQHENLQKTPAETARDFLRRLQEKKAGYDRGTKTLVRGLNEFIDDHLAAMLAAEELGGPVVGEMIDVEDEDLEAGFSQRGKVKKHKPTAAVSDGKRQTRIDQIWGRADDSMEGDGEPRSEKDAAAAEMRALTEELLNVSATTGGGSAAYVSLPRESAAARFLVRAKVAQFHPKDARRLRLIGFARELDDGDETGHDD